jgi:hypothetical protein
MVEAVQASLDRIRDIFCRLTREKKSPQLFVERRVDVSALTPLENQFGTSDAYIVAGHEVHVFDYKHGLVEVDVVENPQLAMYAYGVKVDLFDTLGDDLEWFEPLEFHLHIHQPRKDNISTWSPTERDLAELWLKIQKGFREAFGENPRFNPEFHACKFCRARRKCVARANKVYSMIDEGLEVIDVSESVPDKPCFEEPKSISDSSLVNIWKHRSFIRDFIDDVELEVEHRMMHRQLPELKWVEGRSMRNWKEPDKVPLLLKKQGLTEDQIYKKTLIGPAGVESITGPLGKKLRSKECKEQREKLIVKPRGKPTVAHISDKRVAIEPIADGFEDLDFSEDDFGDF